MCPFLSSVSTVLSHYKEMTLWPVCRRKYQPNYTFNMNMRIVLRWTFRWERKRFNVELACHLVNTKATSCHYLTFNSQLKHHFRVIIWRNCSLVFPLSSESNLWLLCTDVSLHRYRSSSSSSSVRAPGGADSQVPGPERVPEPKLREAKLSSLYGHRDRSEQTKEDVDGWSWDKWETRQNPRLALFRRW